MRNAYSVSLNTGRYVPSEQSALFVPRKVDPAKCAVIYAHGANGEGDDVADWKEQKTNSIHHSKIALAGFVILAGDFGGPHTYGNDTLLSAMEGAWNWLRASGLCNPNRVILSGGSGGFLSISRFAAAHPTEVVGMNGNIPAIDIESLRQTNALGLRNLINTAWGLPADSYIGGSNSAPVPTRGRPLENLATVNHIPTHLWYSTADSATLAVDVEEYASLRNNVNLHVTSTTADHSDEAVAGVDIDAVIDFYKSIAYTGLMTQNVITSNVEETF